MFYRKMYRTSCLNQCSFGNPPFFDQKSWNFLTSWDFFTVEKIENESIQTFFSIVYFNRFWCTQRLKIVRHIND